MLTFYKIKIMWVTFKWKQKEDLRTFANNHKTDAGTKFQWRKMTIGTDNFFYYNWIEGWFELELKLGQSSERSVYWGYNTFET